MPPRHEVDFIEGPWAETLITPRKVSFCSHVHWGFTPERFPLMPLFLNEYWRRLFYIPWLSSIVWWATRRSVFWNCLLRSSVGLKVCCVCLFGSDVACGLWLVEWDLVVRPLWWFVSRSYDTLVGVVSVLWFDVVICGRIAASSLRDYIRVHSGVCNCVQWRLYGTVSLSPGVLALIYHKLSPSVNVSLKSGGVTL